MAHVAPQIPPALVARTVAWLQRAGYKVKLPASVNVGQPPVVSRQGFQTYRPDAVDDTRAGGVLTITPAIARQIAALRPRALVGDGDAAETFLHELLHNRVQPSAYATAPQQQREEGAVDASARDLMGAYLSFIGAQPAYSGLSPSQDYSPYVSQVRQTSAAVMGVRPGDRLAQSWRRNFTNATDVGRQAMFDEARRIALKRALTRVF